MKITVELLNLVVFGNTKFIYYFRIFYDFFLLLKNPLQEKELEFLFLVFKKLFFEFVFFLHKYSFLLFVSNFSLSYKLR